MNNTGIDNLDKPNSPDQHFNKPLASALLSFITPKIVSTPFQNYQTNNNLNGFD